MAKSPTTRAKRAAPRSRKSDTGARDLAEENRALQAQLAVATQRLEHLERVVQEFQGSAAYRLLDRVRRMPGFESARRAAKTVAELIEPVRQATHETAAIDASALTFGGVATRASTSTVSELVDGRPRVVSICHPEWRGVRAATYGQGAHVLEIPGILSDDHAARLIALLATSGCEVVVINAVPPGFIDFARRLHREHPEIRIVFVVHGAPALHVTVPEDAIAFDGLIELGREGALARVGCLKAGVADFLRVMGVPAVPLLNRVPRPPPRPLSPPDDGRTHLGVFVPNVWNKNINTQLAAAAMVPNAVVHVLRMPPSPYFRWANVEFVEHGMMAHDEFVRTLGAMHANLYVTLTECQPMTVLESLAAGAPCVTSHTSSIFDDAPDLFRDLVVTALDAPEVIAAKVIDVVARREDIAVRARKHLAVLDEQARQSWEALVSF